MRSRILFLAAALLAVPAGAATITVSPTNNSTCLHSETNNNGTQSAWNAAGCSNPGTVFGEAQYFNLNNSGVVVSANVAAGSGTDPQTQGNSTSATFGINAGVSTDDVSGDSFVRGQVRYSLTITIDADNFWEKWEVNLTQSMLGLLALKGDGTASAVGTQSNGEAQILGLAITASGAGVNTPNLAFGISGSSLITNPSNNGSATQQFSGGGNNVNIASGMGDASFSVTIAYDLDAFSNDGCSGFICSSITGGEEAAVLNGFDNADGVGNPSADQYSTWGRAVGPDGYDATFELKIVPEPTSLMLLGAGLAGLTLLGRRRR